MYACMTPVGFDTSDKFENHCSRVRNLRKMRNFWANFTNFEPEIIIIKCKPEKLKQKT